ncbi:sigma-70 family RNA polymerase sigma factor [Oceaniovalibus sp. ACAM 378]|uniref:sigma-70 family RNA polymerase sigma factor n=1 Tax=Oceaniovalibus sp. ACAM 378 TaxID=2599923 RepID=UPI0021030C77|nr:sigma-70 family RNA polymerase sigma factor [Oceaniovalibus sp. ACAM 378]
MAEVALGSQVAFSRLYDATSRAAFGVCLRVLNEHEAAEDALQETYIKIWNNADRYKVIGYSPMTWIMTIARNAAIDQLRMRKSDRDIADFSELIVSPGPSPEQSAIAAEESRRIVCHLNKLDTNRRAAIIGVYLQGKSYKELSYQLDVPLNTMRTWLRRGLVALRGNMLQ